MKINETISNTTSNQEIINPFLNEENKLLNEIFFRNKDKKYTEESREIVSNIKKLS